MAEIGIFVGTMYGNSLLVAEEAEAILARQGHSETVLPNLRYGVIALGDSSYPNFCNGGKQFDALLQEQSAQRVGEMLFIDASEHPEPESQSNPWVENWGTLLS